MKWAGVVSGVACAALLGGCPGVVLVGANASSSSSSGTGGGASSAASSSGGASSRGASSSGGAGSSAGGSSSTAAGSAASSSRMASSVGASSSRAPSSSAGGTSSSRPGASSRPAASSSASTGLPDAGPPPEFDAGQDPNPCHPERGVECDGDWTFTNPQTGQPFCNPGCTAEECCSPFHGQFQCLPRNTDGGCPAADIWVDEAQIEDNAFVEYRYFTESSCARVEQCVGGTGTRRLLRFDTWTPNTGGADLFLGQTPQDGISTTMYEWSACHMHHHFNSYAAYELLRYDGTVVATGHKQAFCLLDYYRYPGRNDMGQVYNCGFQGIQAGWQDVYGSELDCQWVDVTDVDPGYYILHIELNGEHLLNESNYNNNHAFVPVEVPAEPGPVNVTEPCTGAARGTTRNCGWQVSGPFTCTPGQSVTVGCSAQCGHGQCTGDTIMRVCDATVGPDCSTRWQIAVNDDSGCGDGSCGRGGDCCSRVAFQCPPSGTYAVFTGAYDTRDDASCTVEVGPTMAP
jgi:hypothetical protein